LAALLALLGGWLFEGHGERITVCHSVIRHSGLILISGFVILISE